MATRPKGATRPPRARLADRDEYPPLGTPVKVATRTGIVMGPPPQVQLTFRSTTSPTLTIAKPITAPAARTPKRAASPTAQPAPVAPVVEPTTVVEVPEVTPVVRNQEPAPVVQVAAAVASPPAELDLVPELDFVPELHLVPEADLVPGLDLIPEVGLAPEPEPRPEAATRLTPVTRLIPLLPKPAQVPTVVADPLPEAHTASAALSAPESLPLPVLGGRTLKRRPDPAPRALPPEEAGSLESAQSRRAMIERARHIIEQGKRRQLLLVAASVIVIAGVLIGTLRYAARADAAAQPNTNWNQITTTAPSTLPSAAVSASVSTVPATSAAAPATSDVPVTPATAAVTSEWMGVLTKNATYGQSLAVGSCAPLAKPGTTAQAQTMIAEYVDCMNDVWGKIFVGANRPFRKASVEFFVNTAVSPCGNYNPDSTSAAYCLNNTTLYVSSTALKKASGDRYYAAELVTHEYAHHVQNLTGILNAAFQVWPGTDEYSRRIEMQAHCLSFAVMSRVPGFEVNSTDVTMFRAGWSAGPGSAKFGSIASQQAYGEKGLAATKVGDCETFSAASVS